MVRVRVDVRVRARVRVRVKVRVMREFLRVRARVRVRIGVCEAHLRLGIWITHGVKAKARRVACGSEAVRFRAMRV